MKDGRVAAWARGRAKAADVTRMASSEDRFQQVGRGA
jgi:hypothetical protein